MPRPIKIKMVHGTPIPKSISIFKPQGINVPQLQFNILSFVEYEAIRLIDVEDHSQTEAAEKMGISQPTISRILKSGRKKIADAIVHGKGLRIQGGTFKLKYKGYCCKDCHASWEIGESELYAPKKCPKCDSEAIFLVKKE